MAKHPKTEFGEFLVQEIKRAGMSQEEFYKEVGIAKPYFYDLLKSAPPQAELQKRMIEVLNCRTGTDVERSTKLMSLAAQGRDEIPADISDLLKANPNSWNSIRDILNNMLAADPRNLQKEGNHGKA